MACLTIKRPLDIDYIPGHPQSHTSKRQRCAPFHTQLSAQSENPFNNIVSKLTSEELERSIKNYVRRHKKHFSKCTSPILCSSDEDVKMSPSSTHESVHDASSNRLKFDQSLYTLNEVKAICEKVVKEREEKLKEEYDKLLYSKLTEQYEAFVKFNNDYLHKRHCDMPVSYVS